MYNSEYYKSAIRADNAFQKTRAKEVENSKIQKRISDITDIKDIENEINNLDSSKQNIRKAIMNKYVSLATPLLNNIINNGPTNNEINEIEYAKQKLELINKLSDFIDAEGFDEKKLDGEDIYRVRINRFVSEIQYLNKYFKNFSSSDLKKLLKETDEKKTRLNESVTKTENFINDIINNNNIKGTDRYITDLKRIITNLTEHKNNIAQNTIDLQVDKDGKIPIKSFLVEKSNKEFQELVKSFKYHIKLKKEEINNTFATLDVLINDLIKSNNLLLLPSNNIILKRATKNNEDINELLNKKNIIMKKFNSIDFHIDLKELEETLSNLILDIENASEQYNKKVDTKNNINKSTYNFKKYTFLVILISVILLILAIVVNNIGIKIVSGIFIIMLFGGLGYFYYRNNVNIQIRQRN